VVASELASTRHKLLIRVVDTPKGHLVVMTNQILRHSFSALKKRKILLFRWEFSLRFLFDRIASQTIAACAASVAPSISHNHKQFLITQQTHVVLFTSLQRPVRVACLTSGPPSQSGEGTTQPFPNTTSPSKREDMHWLA
jgi:hypothetical protein